MQPVAPERLARHVDIDATWIIRDGFARADVVCFRRVQVLHDVIEETPFPNHVALHVHLHDGVHLSFIAI